MISIFIGVFLLVGIATNLQSSGKVDSAASQLIERFQLRESKISSKQHPRWQAPKKVVFWGRQEQAEPLKEKFSKLDIIATNDIAQAKEELKNADIFLGYCIPALLQEKTNVRWIQSMGVGVEGCANSQSLKDSNVLITNTQRLSSPEIAEHSIAMMFALVRQLDLYGKAQAKSEWDRSIAPNPNEIWEIEGRTMLVVGLGGIGTETAR